MAYGDPTIDDPLASLQNQGFAPQNAGPNPADQVANFILRSQQSQQPSPSFQQQQPPQQPYQPRTPQLGGVQGFFSRSCMALPIRRESRHRTRSSSGNGTSAETRMAAVADSKRLSKFRRRLQYHQGLLANQRQAWKTRRRHSSGR